MVVVYLLPTVGYSIHASATNKALLAGARVIPAGGVFRGASRRSTLTVK